MAACALAACDAGPWRTSGLAGDPSAPRWPQPPTTQEHAATVARVLPATQLRKARSVILITADTLRADHLSCYGHDRILTPYIDRLAASGVLFKQAFCQATTTSPSHASLFSGIYPQDHKVYSNFEALGDAVKTLFEILFGRGYKTYAIVNMPHLNPEVSNILQGVATIARGDHPRRARPTIEAFLRWLDTVGDEPYFAWIHLIDTHTPYRPPPPYNRFYYEGDERDPTKLSFKRIWPLLPRDTTDHPVFRAWVEGITDVNYVIAQYKGAVSYIDDELGFLLESLAQRRHLDQTAIVFTSDHGESLGEHDLYFVHYGLYEPTAHVPLIMYFPGSDRQGIVVDQLVELVDVLPTLLEYLDLPLPPDIRGRSLWPFIRGQVKLDDRPAFIEHAGNQLVALRTNRHKYIRHLKSVHILPPYPTRAGREELYDLEKDPHERHDIAALRPEVLRQLGRVVDERRARSFSYQGGTAQIDEETEAVLRALGYVR